MRQNDASRCCLYAPAVAAVGGIDNGTAVRGVADDEPADNLDAGAAACVEGAAVGAACVVDGDGAVAVEHGDGGAVRLGVDGAFGVAESESVGAVGIIGADLAVPDGEGGDIFREGGQGGETEQGGEKTGGAEHGGIVTAVPLVCKAIRLPDSRMEN